MKNMKSMKEESERRIGKTMEKIEEEKKGRE